jgi:hydroxymethylglutaryl-CoA lyase
MPEEMGQGVVVTDVGPRDGLQNQPKILTPADRILLINALLEAGMQQVEVGAFVSAKAVPAMAGTDVVLENLQKRAGHDGQVLSVLVPNYRGYELALAAGARSVCMVLYGSDAMAQANVRMNRQHAESAAAKIIGQAKKDGVRVTSTIAVAFECPFDGAVDPGLIGEIVRRFLDLGADELCLADTIGAANPRQVRSLTGSVIQEHGAEQIGCHFHDTRALGLVNVYAALESGVRRFDASVSGLGGCPFAPGASGNVATEDVVMMLELMGCRTGIDLDALLRASELAQSLTGTAPGGRASAWLKRRKTHL